MCENTVQNPNHFILGAWLQLAEQGRGQYPYTVGCIRQLIGEYAVVVEVYLPDSKLSQLTVIAINSLISTTAPLYPSREELEAAIEKQRVRRFEIFRNI